jgi:pSer/pThr/pTyr-binding forkhead associated (FHA) protein
MLGSTRLYERPAAPPPSVLTPCRHHAVSLRLDQPVITIGRTASNDLRLDHPSVSREHAVIRRTPHGFVLTDLGAVNGVTVNGRRLRAHRPEPLLSTATVRIGEVELRLGYPGELAEAPPRSSGTWVVRWWGRWGAAARRSLGV